MRHSFPRNRLACVLCAAVLAGCEKGPEGLSSLTVGIVSGGADTRIEGRASSYEDDVLTVQLFVFDSHGSLEAEDYFTSCSGSLQVSDGAKTVYALVNSGRIDGPASADALLQTVSKLQENTTDRLVMVGSDSTTINGDTSVTIRVRRLVSKIELGEIAVDFAYGPAGGITINSLYLTNVNSSTTLGGTGAADPSEWFNRMGFESGACDGILFDSIGCTLADKGSYKVAHSFYAYPNSTAEDTHGGDVFCARFTRLVIDTSLGYYHIDFPELLPNKAYIIEKVTIKGPGGDTPEEHVERGTCSFVIKVKDWDTGTSVTEII